MSRSKNNKLFKSGKHLGSFIVMCVSISLFLIGFVFFINSSYFFYVSDGNLALMRGYQMLAAGSHRVPIYDSSYTFIEYGSVEFGNYRFYQAAFILGTQGFIFNILAVTLRKKVFKVFGILGNILGSVVFGWLAARLYLNLAPNGGSGLTNSNLISMFNVCVFMATVVGTVSSGMVPRDEDLPKAEESKAEAPSEESK